MKRFFLLAGVAGIISVSLMSCTKEYTCDCTDNFYDATYEADSRSDAEAACDAIEVTAQFFDPGTTCNLD